MQSGVNGYMVKTNEGPITAEGKCGGAPCYVILYQHRITKSFSKQRQVIVETRLWRLYELRLEDKNKILPTVASRASLRWRRQLSLALRSGR